MTEFVDGWILGHVLGEGAYGEVRLVINKSTNEAVAMKMVNLKKHPDAKNNVKKETTIHRMLSNPFIIQYFGQRSEPNLEYIFLEYASGGELFDRIEPDIGMPTNDARKYFQQLLSAIEYLHSRGVAHRDLKPENLLLDANNNLKVSDFGLATVYRLNGKERLLDKKCGTLPYVAPEVLEQPYLAEPADLWACGIILVASLAGELPWDQASTNCSEYLAWINNKYSFITPWNKLDTSSLSFIKKILVHDPSERYSVSDIKNHAWFNCESTSDKNTLNTKNESTMSLSSADIEVRRTDRPAFCFSQPELPPIDVLSNIKLGDRTGLSFSQPVSFEDLLVSSQLPATQANSTPFHNLVRRMTRCFVTTSSEKTMKIITECLIKKNYHYRVNNCGTITISTVDKRKMPLVFKINIIEMDNKTLIDFRLSKGCGIEFKKEFIKIKQLLSSIVLKDTKLEDE